MPQNLLEDIYISLEAISFEPIFQNRRKSLKKKKNGLTHTLFKFLKKNSSEEKKTFFKNSDFSIWPAFKQSPHIKIYRGMYNLTKSEIKQRVHF